MYQHVLLPLDGSPFGEHALELATTIVRRCGARLELVHVHNENAEVVTWEPVTPFRFEGLETSEREWEGSEVRFEETYLTEKAQHIATDLDGCATCKVLKGPVVTALADEIKAVNPDLVVMATHGRSGFSRLWLGSVADALVRHVHKPMLLVRSASEEDPNPVLKTDHILIPLDGSPLSESILPHAVNLGEGMGSTFTLLRVLPPVWTSPEVMSEPDMLAEGALKERVTEAREYLACVAKLLSGGGAKVNCEVVVGSAAAAAILEFARTRNVDVIAMATHGRGGVPRLILGSVADKVLRGATSPILLYHPEA